MFGIRLGIFMSLASLGSALPAPVTTIANTASVSQETYFIEHCPEEFYDKIAISIDIARVGASLAHQDAVRENLYGFDLFLKATVHGALNMLDSIAKWQFLGYLNPRFACVTPQSSTMFPNINPSILFLCEQRAQPALFLRGHNYIFICPGTWSMPEEPVPPDLRNCPTIYQNEYYNNIIRYRSNFIFEALVNYRLQAEPLPLPNPQGLNSMVRLNGRSSFLSARNYDAYVSMVKNECWNHPNLSLPPWSPFLSANFSEERPASPSVPLIPLATNVGSLEAIA